MNIRRDLEIEGLKGPGYNADPIGLVKGLGFNKRYGLTRSGKGGGWSMKLGVAIPLILFIQLAARPGLAWFANFCQFDRITWSPDGREIAFESHYIPTGEGNTYFDTLIVDLSTGKIRCVTPEVHKFVLSIDRRRALFSDTYGLYLMDLKSTTEPVQVLFRMMNPTVNSGNMLKGLAFSRVDGRILWFFDNMYSGVEQIWGFELATMKDTLLSEGTKRESIVKTWKMLAGGLRPEMVKELKGDRSFPNRRGDRIFHFIGVQPQRGFQNLELEDGKGEIVTTLLKRCKLRLFSWSPDSTKAVFSLRMDEDRNGRVRTYVVDEDGTNMREIAAGEFSSLVWLSSKELLEKVNDTLWKFNLKKDRRERVIMRFVPQWCRKLSPASRLYTVQIKEKNSYQTAKNLGYPAYLIGGNGPYRVGIGGYRDSMEAMTIVEELRQEIKVSYRVVGIEANSIDLPVEFGFVTSPQGDKVAFIRNDGFNGYWYSELWVMNPDGTDEARVVSYMANF